MADIEKRLNKAAVKKAAIWGTAVDTDAAGMGFLPLNPGAPKAAVQMMEDESYGAFETNLNVGTINPSDFGLDFDYRWDGRENLLLAMLMGTAGLPGMYFIVSDANNKLDFGEGGAQITATLTNATYAADALCTEIKTQLDIGGALTYTVTYDATTREFTIAATGEFELKWDSGTHGATDCHTLLGFSAAADDTGAATYSSDVAGVGIALNYLHAFTLKNTAVGLFGTYATEKGATIHTVPTFKVLKSTFSVNAGLIKSSFNLRGISVVDDSALPAAFTSTTVDGNTHARAKFTQAVFQMNAQNGADFDGGGADIIRPKSFSLEIERKMDSEHVAGVQTIVEPVENDKPSVKLTMEFPRMDTTNAAYFADWIAATEKKADLIITGPAVEGAYNYYLKFQFPRLIIEDVEYADSKIIPAKIVLRGVTADSPGPTGMTGLTLPVYVGLMNGRSADYLA
jgi:hypothetical protein